MSRLVSVDLSIIDAVWRGWLHMISAWEGATLVGIARCVTDFHYACHLSDLEVSKRYQKLGAGKKVQQITQGS